MDEPALTVTKDNVAKMLREVEELTSARLLIGLPGKTADRKGDGGGKDPINNPTIGYIMEMGAPEANIPARPFLVPGVAAAQDECIALMKEGARKALGGQKGAADGAMNKAGMAAVSAVQQRILSNIPPPLSETAIRDRWNRQKARKGKPIPRSFRDSVVALINTGAFYRAITYVIRKKGGQSDGTS